MAKKKDIRKDLLRIGKRIVKEGFVISKGGNISAREDSYIYIKKKGAPLGSSDKKSYIHIDLISEKAVSGIPSAERYIHIACYKKRADIKAILHLHPIFSTAVANSRVKLGPISYEFLSLLGSELCRARYKPAGSKELAKEVASLIGKYNAILLPNHGLLVVGKDLDVAFQRAQACERSCQVLIFSKLLGLYKFLPKSEADRIISLYKKQDTPLISKKGTG